MKQKEEIAPQGKEDMNYPYWEERNFPASQIMCAQSVLVAHHNLARVYDYIACSIQVSEPELDKVKKTDKATDWSHQANAERMLSHNKT